jgi:hypothetical protein
VQSPLPSAGNRENAPDAVPLINKAPDDRQDAQPLEIISCGQPLKASAHAVTIPLIMRLTENGAEVKADLTISFNNGCHVQHS